ncbi:hypothetical protein Sgly_1510 [Syntrophobotulus glycolicus DSM 8271]|uniref:Polysaccharide pyruvyl transferase domain-containing protein n=1 Tax=Syntrophobotulus glycolicus (strain DSM 8271 / FlGlyR) TaxID=645991 RepID=F0SX28_SYNGF|nr:polysaccharide pyruvyl transferase family protein [Syntrophobotulus glycolicus]ADY55811.1 hypothetical protein Sgly_1510 [Syntrophobotulus glycolicus DSM 8271]
MNIGILSFPHSSSFGASLQLFALYRSLERLGGDVEVINYHNDHMRWERHAENTSKKPITSLLQPLVRKIIHHKGYRGFSDFERTMRFYPKRCLTHPSGLSPLQARYDLLICGSDQVWNTEITNHDYSYFLDFCTDDQKKASYAPSFGLESFPSATEQEKIGELLKRFRHLCVREQAGQALVKSLTGIVPPIVPDPTLLLTGEEWAGEAAPPVFGDERYLLYYTVKDSEALYRFARRLSAKTGCRLVRIGGNFLNRFKSNTEFFCDATPREWLSLFINAQSVVTNSFHGIAFSINLKKNFFFEYSSDTNSRLKNIVEHFHLENRNSALGENSFTEIDYRQVDSILNQDRQSAVRYLRNMIKEWI